MLCVLIRIAESSPLKHVLGTHLNRLSEAILMSTQNICFNEKKENYPLIITDYPSFSVPMD